MKRKSLFVLAALAGTVAANAALYNFTYSDPSNAAYGTLSTVLFAPGVELATSGSITVTTGTAVGTYALVPNPTPLVGSYVTSPLGGFWYDSFLMPELTPDLTLYGLVWSDGTKEVSIWGNSHATDYSFYAYLGNGVWDPAADKVGTFTLEAVPEPFTMILGVAGLGVAIARRRRRA